MTQDPEQTPSSIEKKQPAQSIKHEKQGVGDIHADRDVIIGDQFNIYPEAPLSIPPPYQPDILPKCSFCCGRDADIKEVMGIIHHYKIAAITGPRGIGKTTLAAVLANELSSEKKVFWYQFVRGDSADTLIWRLASFLAWHGQSDLWNYLHKVAHGGELPPLDAVAGYLLQLLGGNQYLICLDDIHHAFQDPRFNKIIHLLLPVLLEGQITLLLTSEQDARILGDQYIYALAGLPLQSAGEFCKEFQVCLPEEYAEKLWHQTDGSPLLLELTFQILQRSAAWGKVIDKLVKAPVIEDFILNEIDLSLSVEEQSVMQALAVLQGYPSQAEALEAVLDQVHLQSHLNQLSARYLITVSQDDISRTYRQTELLQDYYYSTIQPSNRQRMHARAAEYYLAGEIRNELLAAYHYQKAGETSKSVEIIVELARSFINEGGAILLRQILEGLSFEGLDSLTKARIHMVQGRVCTFLGETDLARKIYQQAISILDELPDSGAKTGLQARAYQGMAELLEFDTPAQAITWLEKGLALVPEGPNPEKTALQIKLSSVYLALGEIEKAQGYLTQEMTRLPGESAHDFANRLINLGLIHSMKADFECAEKFYRASLDASDALNDTFRALKIRGNLAVDKEIQGQWADALQEHQQALELAKKLGSVTEQAKLHNNLGVLYTNLGEYTDARKNLTKALALVRGHQLGEQEPYVLTSLIELELREGNWEAAADLLALTERLILEKEIHNLSFYPALYSSLIQLGKEKPQVALEAAREAVAKCEKEGLDFEKGLALRVLGMALHASGRLVPALEAFAQSCELLSDDPYEMARTQAQWAKALSNTQPDQARVMLDAAQKEFERLGAGSDLDHAN